MVVLHYTYSLCSCCYSFGVLLSEILASSLLRSVFFFDLAAAVGFVVVEVFNSLLDISSLPLFHHFLSLSVSLTRSSRSHYCCGGCCLLLLLLIIRIHTELVWLLKMEIEMELEFSGIEVKWKIWNLNGIWIVNRCWNSKQNLIHGKHTKYQTAWKFLSAKEENEMRIKTKLQTPLAVILIRPAILAVMHCKIPLFKLLGRENNGTNSMLTNSCVVCVNAECVVTS